MPGFKAFSLSRPNFLAGWSAVAWAVFLVMQRGVLRLCFRRAKSVRNAGQIGLFVLIRGERGAVLDFGLRQPGAISPASFRR